MAEPTTIAEALNSVTDDDVVEETAEDEGTEGTGTLLDEEDEPEADEDEEPAAEEADEARTGDVEGEPEAEAEPAAEPGDPDIFDELTAEEINAIKADPTLNKLRRSLMRTFSTKTTEHSQLVQLGQAYRKDPQGVLKAIADSLGMTVVPAQAAAPATTPAAAPAAKDPGQELEELFGPQIGPKVRAVFDKWAEARIGPRVAPLEQTLGKVTQASEQARMQSEEQAFKARHKDLTPAIEAEIVALGNSGKIVPGDMTPAEYLDTLHDVVMARRSRLATRTATKQAATKLATKIEANRKDREPSGVSGRGGSVQKVSRIAEARNISEALDMAMEELEAESR